MNTENEMNEEVRQLLDSLEEHGKNIRRQQELNDLIDRLAEEEKTVEILRKHRRLTPLWWALSAAAACLLLWLLTKPSLKEAPETDKEILVEETETLDSVKTEANDVVFEEPVIKGELLAEETPVVPQKPQMNKEKPQAESVEEVVEQPILAEVTPTKNEDSTNIGSNTIPASIEEKLSTINYQLSTQHSPKRRVIRSLNLVCYECQKEPEFFTKPVMEDKTLFGQPQDPNMKNGSLAFEIKLN